LNGHEIIGFAAPGAGTPPAGGAAKSPAHFDLDRRLEQARAVELTRIMALAVKLSQRFGPDVVVGFLYYEILGRPPDRRDHAERVERLRQSPSSAPAIVEELLNAAEAELREPSRRPA
jgi:hypothetical protein